MLQDISFNSYNHLKTSKKKIYQVKDQSTNSLFELLIFLLQYNPITKRIEIVSVMIQLLQLLGFFYDANFTNSWNISILYRIFNKLFVYVRIIPLLKENGTTYLIAYYLVIVYILCIVFLMILLSAQQSKKEINSLIISQYIAAILPFNSFIFFIPITETIFSIFTCQQDKRVSNAFGNCWSGQHITHLIIGSITLIIFLILSFIIINTYYDFKYKGNAFVAKARLYNDNIFLFNKCLIIISISLANGKKVSQIYTLTLVLFLTYQSYLYTMKKSFYSFIIQKCYMFMSYTLLWTFLLLLMNEITNNTIFNDNCLFWLIGIGIEILGCVFMKKKKNFNLIMKQHIHLSSGEEVIEQVEEILELVYPKDKQRASRIALFGYIKSFNSRSTDKDNPLLNYFDNLNEKKNAIFVILHLREVLEYALSKYPECASLRIFYAVYLYEFLSKREQAFLELERSENYMIHYSQQFFIYRIRKEFEAQIYPQMGNSVSLLTDNKLASVTFLNLLQKFKALINKASLEYIDFWNILSNANDDNQNDLSQLNSIGLRIKKDVDNIHQIYDELNHIKPYDQEIMLDYWYFEYNIIKDQEKSQLIMSQIKDLSEMSQTIDESNLCHIDPNNITVIDDIYFILFSAMPATLGRITNISLPLCSLFGYTKEELIGEPIEKLLPEMYANGHQRFLMYFVNKYKKVQIDNYIGFNNIKVDFIDQSTYAISKSRYLLPIQYKATFFPNDNTNQYFYMKIYQDNTTNVIANKTIICYVLTDLNLIIQNFTPNATNLLGLNSESINSLSEITDHINQFNEEYLKSVIDLDNQKTIKKFDNSQMNLKRKIIKSKYFQPTAITWIDYNRIINNYNYLDSQKFSYNSSKILQKARLSHIDENFMMTVSDFGDLPNDSHGFIFKFEPIWHYNLRTNTHAINESSSAKEQSNQIIEKKGVKSLNDVFDFNALRSPSKIFPNSNIKITKNYIPNLTKQFILDPVKRAFYQKQIINKEEYIEQIKYEVELKRQKKESNHKILSNNDSSSNTSDGSFHTSSDASYSLSKKSKNSFQGTMDLKNISNWNKKEEDYYHVNMLSIKFLIYDFEKKVVIEQLIINKISEVQNKLDKEYDSLTQDKDFDIDKTPSAKRLFTVLQKNINIKQGNFDHPDKENFNESLNKEMIKSQKEKVKKEIKKALINDTNQKTITLLYLLSILSFTLAIGKEIAYMLNYMNVIDRIENRVLLLRSSLKLHRNYLLGAFSIRELTLIYTQEYNIPDKITKPQYIGMYMQFIEIYYKENEILLSNMTKSIQMSSSERDEINKIAGLTYHIIKNNFQIGNNSNTFTAALNSVNNALLNILSSKDRQYIQTNEDIFYYLTNVYNNVWIGITKTHEIYHQLFHKLYQDLYWQLIFIFCFASILLFSIYLIARIRLLEVSKRNDSYLAVFFAIKKEDIKLFLHKCEDFSYIFQTSQIKDKFDNINFLKEDIDIESNSLNNEQEGLVLHKPEIESIKVLVQNPRSLSCIKRLRRKYKCEGLFLFGHAFLISGAIGVFAFDFVLLYQMMFFRNDISDSILIYKSQATILSESLLIFNQVREYIFEKNCQFKFEPLQAYIENGITNIYEIIQNEKTLIDRIILNLPKEVYDYYYSINYKDICTHAKNRSECVLKTDNSALYGMENLLMYFYEEVRGLYYTQVNKELMHKKFNFTYNYTVFGTEEFDKYFPTNPGMIPLYKRVGTISLFNTDVHERLTYMYWSLVQPACNQLTKKFGDFIEENNANMKQYCIMTYGIMIGFIMFIVLFIWFPFIHRLNINLYKTKNMLSIIPIDLLVSLKNINGLLDINQNIDLYENEIQSITTTNKLASVQSKV